MVGKHHPRGRNTISETIVCGQKGTSISKAVLKKELGGGDGEGPEFIPHLDSL